MLKLTLGYLYCESIHLFLGNFIYSVHVRCVHQEEMQLPVHVCMTIIRSVLCSKRIFNFFEGSNIMPVFNCKLLWHILCWTSFISKVMATCISFHPPWSCRLHPNQGLLHTTLLNRRVICPLHHLARQLWSCKVALKQVQDLQAILLHRFLWVTSRIFVVYSHLFIVAFLSCSFSYLLQCTVISCSFTMWSM